MAYSEKDLNTQWMPEIRWADGENVNLVNIRSAIQEEADQAGIPVAFREDILKTGGLFNRQQEEILIMFNPEHPTDYLRFAIRVWHQGRYGFMGVYNLGGSKNFANANAAASGSTLKKLTGLFGGREQKLKIEQNYYDILHDCLNNVAGI